MNSNENSSHLDANTATYFAEPVLSTYKQDLI